MTEYNHNALVVANPYTFKMPKFGKRQHHLKQKLEELYTDQEPDVIGQTEQSAGKSIFKLSEFINEGELTVEPVQQDITGTFILWNIF